MTSVKTRTTGILAILVLGVGLSACGGGDGDQKAAKGTPENPIQVDVDAQERNEDKAAGRTPVKPGYGNILKQQQDKPQTRFSPCDLVTRGQASAILGGRVTEPIEAGQGPTCIYRTGNKQVTLTVQALRYDKARKALQARRDTNIGGRRAVCGVQGQPMLQVRVSSRQTLSITAPCKLGREFATRAVPRLDSALAQQS